MAGRLSAAARAEDVVARHGGDEFLVLLDLGSAEDSPDPTAAVRAAGQRLLACHSEPVETAAGPLRVGLSLGASLFPIDAADVLELLDHADEAMYDAKQSKEGQQCVPHHRWHHLGCDNEVDIVH